MAAAHHEIRRQVRRRRLPRPRVFLDRNNPLESMDDDKLFKRYRFRGETIRFIVDICHNAARATGRSFALPLVLAVCTYLRYLATGGMMLTVGDAVRISQSTVSRCSRQVGDVLVGQIGRFVYFPTGAEVGEVKQRFGHIAGFPNVIGCIDCTHVWIHKPSLNPEDFIGRKGIPTLNVQAVCDDQFVIRSLVARWPGRTNDARIWRNCELKMKFDNGEHQGLLLGDSGYPLSMNLMTPYLNPQNRQEERYNGALCRTRVIVEQTFGILKQRFQILRRKMICKPSQAIIHIQNCVSFHNIGIQWRDIIDTPEIDNDFDATYNDVDAADGLDGRIFRDHIAQTYFHGH